MIAEIKKRENRKIGDTFCQHRDSYSPRNALQWNVHPHKQRSVRWDLATSRKCVGTIERWETRRVVDKPFYANSIKHSTAVRNRFYEQQFVELTTKWRIAVGGYSTSRQITRNGSYFDIIGMGEKALPFIFKDMANEPDYWFEALKHITKVDPVPASHYGDLYKMTDDWLKWAREHNYLR